MPEEEDHKGENEEEALGGDPGEKETRRSAKASGGAVHEGRDEEGPMERETGGCPSDRRGGRGVFREPREVKSPEDGPRPPPRGSVGGDTGG